MNNKNFKTGQYVIVEGKCEGVKHDGRLLINFFGENPELTAVYPKNVLPIPQKVVIPKFVAEWIDYCKANKLTLLGAIDPVSEHGIALANTFTGKVRDCTFWATRNQNAFARAWLDGYEVEKEQLYTVEIPNNDETLVLTSINGRLKLDHGYKHAPAKLTEGKIRDKYDWAWQWAKPVEE